MNLLNKVKNKIIRFWFIRIKRDRVAYARKLGVKIGKGCNLLCDPLITFGSEPFLVKIGNNVEVTHNVHFITHKGELWVLRHLDNAPEFSDIDIFSPITVGNNVYIAENAYIMPGVKIGNNVIIGSYSFVNKDLPDNSVFAGIPARKISSLEDFKIKTIQKWGGVQVHTKGCSQTQKKAYLLKNHPEFFN